MAVVHWPNGFFAERGGVEFPFALAVGTVAVVLMGPGALDPAIGLALLGAVWAAGAVAVATAATLAVLGVRHLQRPGARAAADVFGVHRTMVARRLRAGALDELAAEVVRHAAPRVRDRTFAVRVRRRGLVLALEAAARAWRLRLSQWAPRAAGAPGGLTSAQEHRRAPRHPGQPYVPAATRPGGAVRRRRSIAHHGQEGTSSQVQGAPAGAAHRVPADP
jgi:hypothetical protein